MGALSVTTNPKYQKPFAPLIPDVDVGRLNDLEGINELVGKDTCTVIVEPIQGEGGVNAASEDWLRALRKRCDEVGAVLIFDEIQVHISDLYNVKLTGCSADYTGLARSGHTRRFPWIAIRIL